MGTDWVTPLRTGLYKISKAAIFPVTIFLTFVIFWFVAGPAIWWWIYVYRVSVWPDNWAIIYWLVMLAVWCIISILIVFFLKQCSVLLGANTKEAIELSEVSTLPSFQASQKHLGKLQLLDVWPHYITRIEPSKHNIGNTTVPNSYDLVIGLNSLLSTVWFLESERDLCMKESQEIVSPDQCHSSDKQHRKLQNEMPCYEEKKIKTLELSPREIFFIDMVEPAFENTNALLNNSIFEHGNIEKLDSKIQSNIEEKLADSI